MDGAQLKKGANKVMEVNAKAQDEPRL